MTDSKEDGEKLFASGNHSDVKSPETVKFIPENDNKNGISPISVDNVKATFTGLTKEELLKYANDPFWVRTRWILFGLFWVVWLCMLLGAVFIIVVTPKCKEPPPPVWWRRSPMYVIDLGQLYTSNNSPADNGSSIIEVLKNRINHLKTLGVESVLLKNMLQTNQNSFDEVTNFTNVNYYLESSEVFQKEIVKYAGSKGINIILSFVPNYSGDKNEMFIRSAGNENDYKDSYVWYPLNYTEKPAKPPNNWLSVFNGSAWQWDNGRKQYYLHQFNISQPDFNFRSQHVLDLFDQILKYWLNFGIKGFHMDKSEYLVEDANFTDEIQGQTHGSTFNEYVFNSHYRTRDRPETKEILKKWSDLIRNNSGILGVSGGVQEESSIADFLTRPVIFPSNFSAVELNNTIAKWINRTEQPIWEWRCGKDNEDCIPADAVDGLTITSFFLPGTPVLNQGQEFGLKTANDAVLNNDKFEELKKNATGDGESHLNIIKTLIEKRASPALTYGEYNSTVVDENIFIFTRVKSGSPGFVVAWNLGRNETVVDLHQSLPIIPTHVLVVVKSGHVFGDKYGLKKKVPSSNVAMPARAAIVFSFVPDIK